MRLKSGMRLKHGTNVRVRCERGWVGPSDDLVPLEHLGAHLTVLAVMHGKVSGLSAGDGAKVRVTVDKADVLVGDQLCDCERCVA